MKIVTVARRPCIGGAVTKNVLEYQTGALNINKTRIGTSLVASSESLGRWPANLVLQHLPGCTKVGTVKIEGYIINRWDDGAKPFGGGAGHEYSSFKLPDEVVPVWDCVVGCAAHTLGQQSDHKTSGAMKRTVGAYDGESNTGFLRGYSGPSNQHGDSGTAARFFEQVQAMSIETIPGELWDYLTLMISPPAECNPVIIVADNLGAVDFSKYEDASVHGLISVGDPAPWMDEIDRVLRPGAHFLIFADEEDPTGSTGACTVEDFGYEIRDAIAILDTAEEIHYSAKASRKERNDGVVPREKVVKDRRLFLLNPEDLKAIQAELHEIVPTKILRTMLKKGIPVDLVPEEMWDQFELRVSETRRVIQNDHTTLKPINVMVSLLKTVPLDALVVDLFQGSGTTGISCLLTGHNYVGIEKDKDSMTIVDQRVRHWDRKVHSWLNTVIESEASPPENPVPISGGLFDLFGDT